MQVLHTRSCSGTGMSFVRFLTACYLTFNMDSLTVAKALEALPALPLLTASQGTYMVKYMVPVPVLSTLLP